MSFSLRPMSAESFAAWNERLVVEYAREKVAAGVWHMMKRIPQA